MFEKNCQNVLKKMMLTAIAFQNSFHLETAHFIFIVDCLTRS